MGRIMDVFDAEFLNFRELCDGLDLTAEINYKTYPPKMVVRRLETLLDAAEDESEETAIVIAGGIEQEIMVKGEFALRRAKQGRLTSSILSHGDTQRSSSRSTSQRARWPL